MQQLKFGQTFSYEKNETHKVVNYDEDGDGMKDREGS